MRVIFALAASATTASAVVVQRPELVFGWETSDTNLAGTESVNSDDQFSFKILVQDQNMDELREYVAAISDPTNERYGEGMTGEEVSAFTAPLAEDTAAVTSWLDNADGCSYDVDEYGRAVTVDCTVSAAEKLLSTKIGHLVNSKYQQEVVRADDYEVPDEVDAATDAIFGLHGLPIPRQRPLTAAPGEPADVTPSVIATTYSISGVTPKGTTTNRMAVAEFQGQTEKDSDIVQFFKSYVPTAQPGDDKVYAFVGDKDQQSPQVEASLDIQYIMGVAPHVKAEFWLFDPSDFCGDLETWTADIIKKGTDGPNVHSVSYGWQGNLTQVQCDKSKYTVVDANFAKIAATRKTIIFASGDSGSGYAPPQPDCSDLKKDTANEGTVERVEAVQNAEECCEISSSSAGFTFEPSKAPPSPGPTCAAGDYGKKNTAYKGKPIQTLKIPDTEPEICCQIARRPAPEKSYYFTLSPSTTEANTLTCELFKTTTGQIPKKGSFSGVPQQQVSGNCTQYSKVTGSSSKTGATSGSSPAPTSVTLWPSWPASSPYVTSVGATRFVDQKVGQPEMATDQFGSGGGFSKMFDQTHATWQTDAVKQYTSNPPSDPHYPPAGSFPLDGRATPDISALGEGYQVVIGGAVQAVGGTSASTPAFAGILALLNEAREQAGKPAMGLLNPFLYQNADCFTDVTLGTNAIGRGTGPIKYGFNATKGWDPATGLGTPIFDKLLKAALK